MLSWTGWQFTCSPSDVDETPLTGEDPACYVQRLAHSKMRAAAELDPGTELVLAADTVVVDGNLLLGKPTDADDARRMLMQLRNRTHQVMTALAIYNTESQRTETELCRAEVKMRSYSDEEIKTYIESRDPLDKAGAYAIQNLEFHPVTGFQQCYACVMGLPLCHMGRAMQRIGLSAPVHIPSVCQTNLNYDCPVWVDIYYNQDA